MKTVSRLAIILLVLLSCTRNTFTSLTEKQRNEKVISIAQCEVVKRFEIPERTKVLVELMNSTYAVTFKRNLTIEDSPLSMSYYCNVFIDSKTGKVIRVATGI